MVSSPEVQAAAQSPGIRLMGTVQLVGQVAKLEGTRDVQINGATLYELSRPLIPSDFRGKVSISIHVVEIIEPPKNPSPE